MNTSQLKEYAPKARRDFIKAVMDRAAYYGLTKTTITPLIEKGDVVVIGDKAFPREVAFNRKTLETRIHQEGFDQVMESIAYTWFNRFMAIRFMELHGYLDQGYRVLSHPEGQTKGINRPEILDHATDVDLPGLDRARVVELKLDSTQDEELYRMLLLAQCNALHKAMPFLFEKIGDETELLLPANLLHTDSLIRQMVDRIDESAWQEIEIIGWLYQFYISEKKAQVIGKVVASVDIPAATQLFTPNWIVKYMVQNSLGAQWLATYPNSLLAEQMDYYIEPAEQTDEVTAQLAAITPDTLNPEALTLIDPASGSGHILVEAYELFKAIYLERGYQKRNVAQLILEKNLFGLDIDRRAAQLTGFALMMKGRADDRRLFERGVKLNVMALVNSTDFDAEPLTPLLRHSREGGNPENAVLKSDLDELKRLFEHATTFGSLIQVPEGLAAKLPALRNLSEDTGSDIFVSGAFQSLKPLVQQAEMLAAQYDAVVANPPYMGRKYYNPELLRFSLDIYPTGAANLFSIFMQRGKSFTVKHGRFSMITLHNWMFLQDFTEHRQSFCNANDLFSLLHLGPDAFPEISGEVVQAVVFVAWHARNPGFVTACDRRVDGDSKAKQLAQISATSGRYFVDMRTDFTEIDGRPILYWFSDNARAVFKVGTPLLSYAKPRAGLSTGDNTIFQRRWYEVSIRTIGFSYRDTDQTKDGVHRWFPCNSGGETIRWYGNHDIVVDWQYDGRRIKGFTDESGKLRSRPQNTRFYFSEGVTWNKLGSSGFCARYKEAGFAFDDTSRSSFPSNQSGCYSVLGILNSRIGHSIITALNPSMSFTNWDLARMPIVEVPDAIEATCQLVALARRKWDRSERSWNYAGCRLIQYISEAAYLKDACHNSHIASSEDAVREMDLEFQLNDALNRAYGLSEQLTPSITEAQRIELTDEVYMQELVSYAIGCMMGRYSLDKPSLIYAHSGNEGFDPSRYTTFEADDDGIIPLTDTDWFADDAANRLIEFISVALGKEQGAAHLEDNLTFLADNLSPKKNESSRETLRRYLCDSFFKDHLKTYKKRPIYWLFSSGKQKAFQCLVYLHRYNEGTLARMRMEYVIPLQGKINARIDQLKDDIDASNATSHRRKLEKERDILIKQRTELQPFDENLRHYADKKITLDLDDGVKVNYGKFGGLLAEVKAVTGIKKKGA